METNGNNFVYLLTNKVLKGEWVKIGCCKYRPNAESQFVKQPDLPLPYDIKAALETPKANEVMNMIVRQAAISKPLQPGQNQSFINLPLKNVVELMKGIASILDITIVFYHNNIPINQDDEDEEQDDDDNGEESQQKTRKPRFRFSMVGIHVGEYVTFDPTGEKVIVVSDQKVSYRGRNYRLSTFTKLFVTADLRTNSDSYQGAKYFSYKGKTLFDLRKEKEDKSFLLEQ